MSPDFLKILPWLYDHEGKKFENDPDDPGGATKFGIDQRSHPRVNIRSLTEDQATQIYWDEYWNKYACDHYDHGMDYCVFNACVNCGFGRVEKLLVAAKGGGSDSFLDAQEDFYRRLSDARTKSRKYLKGWLNRTADLRKFISQN